MAGCRVDRLFIMVLHYSQGKINLVMVGRTYHRLSSQADVKNLTKREPKLSTGVRVNATEGTIIGGIYWYDTSHMQLYY